MPLPDSPTNSWVNKLERYTYTCNPDRSEGKQAHLKHLLKLLKVTDVNLSQLTTDQSYFGFCVLIFLKRQSSSLAGNH